MPVIVRSAKPLELVPLHRLVTLATVVDVTARPGPAEVTRSDLAQRGVADIGGCILCTGWYDRRLAGEREEVPYFGLDGVGYLLQGGVRTVASDFPMTREAADLLLLNDCVLVHSLSNVSELTKEIVKLIALPLKLEGESTAPARVIAIEE